uniref:DUF393 domain-containing protein n=2 Tax=Magallana gigas TaxID=29159 RepID=A0A8W8ND04_MAGGI|eukprot:XP_011445134.1 PREDICTED: uncharacterized protein At5g50100, mitochondrial [Crassostrea gigas]
MIKMRLPALYKGVCTVGNVRSFHLSQRINKTKVLYDGDCPLCRVEINFLKLFFNKERKVKFVDITKNTFKAEDHLGITYEEAMGNMHVIGEDDKVYKKMDGIREMYRGVGLKPVATFTELPVVRPLADKMYDYFAANRFRLAGRDESCNCKKD